MSLLAALSAIQAQPLPLAYETFCNLSGVVDIKNAGDDRMFLVRQSGNIRIANADGSLVAGDFLNISTLITTGSERGLLGLAFHPDFANNRFFYVNYTGAGGHTRIARYQVSASNPNQADASSALVLLTINQDFSNHNGGHLAFGPDGYLYIGMGDGGSGGDPNDRAQDPSQLLGKMLRIDVDNTDAGLNYAIPASNPFVGQTPYRPEIWAMGMRNPWKFTFDRLTGDLWIADVGQNQWEEVNIEAGGSAGGYNYGWDCFEATHTYETAGCTAPEYIDPIFEYSHSLGGGGASITGGYVYRGAAIPQLYGWYICADYVFSHWWFIQPDGNGWNTNYHLTNFLPGGGIVAFGEDAAGEIYFSDAANSIIYKLVNPCAGFDAAISSVTDESCAGTDGAITLLVSGGQTPYNYVWEDGSVLPTHTGLSAGDYAVTVSDEQGCTSQLQATVAFQCVHLGLRFFLEGAYTGLGTMHNTLRTQNLLPADPPYTASPWNFTNPISATVLPTDVVDWVYIELRDALDPILVMASGAGLLGTDGTLLGPDGSEGLNFDGLSPGSYRIAIFHRNHLAVITSAAYSLPDVLLVDLRTDAAAVEDTEQLKDMGDGFFALYAGDCNGSGVINASDYSIWAANNAAVNLYLSQDANLNGVVNATDYNLWIDESAKVGSTLIQF